MVLPASAGLLLASALMPARAMRALQAQAGRQRGAGSARVSPRAAEISMPFPVGEKLDYRVGWSTFDDAASVELAVPERRNLFGWTTWHFRAAIHTLHTVRTLFAIDDQFDSYTDASTLECRQFEMYLNELGKTESDVFRLVAAGQRSRAPGAAVIVLPGTRDPLGMLFTIRAVDWQRTPELRLPVYDGRTLYEMRAHIEAASDSVQVAAGSFLASRIAISLFQNEKQETAIHFTVWIANNREKTPVQFAAELPFGNLRVQLTAANFGGAVER